MKVSLNAISQLVDFELPPVDELIRHINEQLGGVEEVIDLAGKYKDAKIVRVVECEKHGDADKLSVCKIDAGTGDLIQVVCGAPNVHADMWAVWLPPESVVPATFDDDEPFRLAVRDIRGVTSNGMLAAPDELAIGDGHDGILEMGPDEVTQGDGKIEAGASFAKVFGLDDTVIDIENKMFTHRPDCFGQLGVAREIAGILGKAFKTPSKYLDDPVFEKGNGLQLEVVNDVPDQVSRFMAMAVRDVTVKSSPLWLQCELVRLGGKPINNIVDVTNYIMLMTAQPVHAYDYDKVSTGKLGIRMAKKGETVALLNGKIEELNDSDIVITDGKKPIGLGGVMGGSETEVSAETKNIILECANFDMYTIRRTSMHHGLFTDAVTRFTKGQSPLQNDRVMQDLFKSVVIVAGGEPASDVIDEMNLQTFSERTVHAPLSIDDDFINHRLGLKLSNKEIKVLLENVEFSHDDLNYVAPYWRTDIEIAEDIVEEVGRLYGFDKLPQELPARGIAPAVVLPERELKTSLRDILSRAGANEVMTYSFVHKNILERSNQRIDACYQLSNALSPDLHYLRLSVLPSLMDKIHMNARAGYDKFAIFEIGKGHDINAGTDDQGVPLEDEFLSLAMADGGFYEAKAIVEYLADQLNLKFKYRALTGGAFMEPKRSAGIVVGDITIGIVGEFRTSVRGAFKLPDISSGFEIDISQLINALETASGSYKPLSKYPYTDRDITFQVEKAVPYGDIEEAVSVNLEKSDLETSIKPVGIYQPEGSDKKNVTLRIRLTSHERTLTGDEVADVITQLTADVCDKVNARVI